MLAKEISEVIISESTKNEFIWCGSENGQITVNNAFENYREKAQMIKGRRNIWQSFIPPKVYIFSWKAMNNKLRTCSILHQWGLRPSLVCIGCIFGVPEDDNHLLLYCNTAKNLWNWLSDCLAVDLTSFNRV